MAVKKKRCNKCRQPYPLEKFKLLEGRWRGGTCRTCSNKYEARRKLKRRGAREGYRIFRSAHDGHTMETERAGLRVCRETRELYKQLAAA